MSQDKDLEVFGGVTADAPDEELDGAT